MGNRGLGNRPRWLVACMACAFTWVLLASGSAYAVAPDAFEPDDFPGQAGVLSVDVPSAQAHTISMGDMDLVRIDVEVGRTYEFVVTPMDGPGTAQVTMTLWPDLTQQGPATSLANVVSLPSAPSTSLSFTATQTETWFLEVWSSEPSPEGQRYSLSAYSAFDMSDAREPDDANPWAGSPLDVFMPPDARFLMPGETDWATVVIGDAGEYAVFTDWSAGGPPPDTLVEVYDTATDTWIGSNDDAVGGGPLSRVTALTATGPTVWQVRITSVRPREWGAYRVGVEATAPSQGTVQGIVTDPDGAPATGAVVELIGPDRVTVTQTTLADYTGAFAFSGVPFSQEYWLRADLPGAGLVPAMAPDVRHLSNPEMVPGDTLSESLPTAGYNLQIKRPWVSGWLYSSQTPFPMLPGIDVTVHALDGTVIGTGTTNASGVFIIELPPYTVGQCKVEFSDPSGQRVTTWWFDSPDAAGATPADLPTFGGLSVLLDLAPPVQRDVLYDLGDVRLVFDEVISAGGVTANQVAPAHPPRAGHRMLDAAYYDIHPTIGFTGGATVTIAIPEAERGNAESVRLFHWQGGEWRDITTAVDSQAMTVTGRTTSFSDFSLQVGGAEVEADATLPPLGWALAALAVALGVVWRARIEAQ